ncbi:MAG: TonB-dependent receptor, partial [Caulobacteraceae bacterium]|nr:TonB-dependent receptor [Caulobacteraceae bacterium]
MRTFRKSLVWSCGVAALVSMLPAIATAQVANIAQPPQLEEVIVTAQHRAERLEDVPISIATVDTAALQAAGVADTRDLKQLLPGVNINAVGVYVQPTIRGITTSVTGPGADSNVAIYVDGVYQTAQTGAVFTLPDVSRIEVAKGPQGTLFGRNATGGAIQ